MTSYQKKAEDIIAKFEGFRTDAYLDQAGVWTIGFGFTKGVQKGHTITMEDARKRLSSEVATYSNAVDRLVKNKDVTDDQKAALTSFAYNVGVGALEKSTLLKRLNEGDMEGAASEFARWSIAGGRHNRGLAKRRSEEAALFQGKEVSGTTWQVAQNSKSSSNSGVDLSDPTQILARTRALASELGADVAYEDTTQRWMNRLRQEARG